MTGLQATLPLLKEQVDQQRDLERQGYGVRQKLLQDEHAYVGALGDLQAEIARLAEARGDFVSDAAKARRDLHTFYTQRHLTSRPILGILRTAAFQTWSQATCA